MGTFLDESTVIRYNLHKLGFNFYGDDTIINLSKKTGISNEKIEEVCKNINDTLASMASELRQMSVYDKLMHSSGGGIIFIGDSITTDLLGHYNIIKNVLKENKNFLCFDGAVSGDTTTNVNNRFYASILSRDFKVAFIMLGTNDCRKNNDALSKQMVSLEEYRANMEYFINILTSLDKKIVLTTIPPVDCEKLKVSFAADNYLYETKVICKYNDVIRQLAQKHNIILNDLYNALNEEYKVYPFIHDGLHLNADAQKFLAKRELDILGQIMGE